MRKLIFSAVFLMFSGWAYAADPVDAKPAERMIVMHKLEHTELSETDYDAVFSSDGRFMRDYFAFKSEQHSFKREQKYAELKGRLDQIIQSTLNNFPDALYSETRGHVDFFNRDRNSLKLSLLQVCDSAPHVGIPKVCWSGAQDIEFSPKPEDIARIEDVISKSNRYVSVRVYFSGLHLEKDNAQQVAITGKAFFVSIFANSPNGGNQEPLAQIQL